MSLGHFDHVVIELICRIAGDSRGPLHLRIRAEHKARGVNRIARGIHHLFEQQSLKTDLSRANRADKTAAAGTDNDEIVGSCSFGTFFGRSFCGAGGKNGGTGYCGGSAFKKMAARRIIHDEPPSIRYED